MILYCEFFLIAYLFLLIGLLIGVKLSIRFLNTKIFDDLAETSLKKAVRQASAIQCILSDEAFKMVNQMYNFPYTNPEIQELIKKGIHLN
jgi:hypothetical protein